MWIDECFAVSLLPQGVTMMTYDCLCDQMQISDMQFINTQKTSAMQRLQQENDALKQQLQKILGVDPKREVCDGKLMRNIFVATGAL